MEDMRSNRQDTPQNQPNQQAQGQGTEDEVRSAQQALDDERGVPGGGVGRRDEVGRTGIYPLSADTGASEDAKVEPEQAFGQGARGVAGYEDSGESEIIPPDELTTTGDEEV